MIPVSSTKFKANDWHLELQKASISLFELLDYLELKVEDFAFSLWDRPSFKLKVPPAYLAKIKKGDPKDPLLMQILPRADEQITVAGFNADPLTEANNNLVSGLIKKYKARALLLASSVCPLHCRYCFRQNFAYANNSNLAPALAALKLDKSIFELILSGGDPLSLSNVKIAKLIRQIEKIPHIQILRIHTRFPATVPSRLDKELFNILASSNLKIVMVTHLNHPQELDNLTLDKLNEFTAVAIMLNQSVLLAGINDNAAIQIELAHKLFRVGVLPYYLHLLDQVKGAAHFKVDKEKARNIVKKMQAQLPGYLVPKLVVDQPGTLSKTILV